MPLTKSPTTHRLPLLLTLTLLLLIANSAAGISVASSTNLPSPRFFYAAAAAATPSLDAASQTKVRLLRQTNSAALPGAAEAAAVPEDEGSCCQGAAAAAGTPVTLPLELATDLSNITADYDVSGEISSKENFKRSVTRSAIRNATPAICSPQPTIVELKPPSDEAGGFNVYYTPACTRINRCNGCCGSTLISCQPTQTEKVQMRVRKFERGGTTRVSEIIVVEQHLACRCDCRIKAEDCNAYQLYRRELCRCECQNTDARDKCLEQADSKYWDDANCTCACRYNQSCTTGTVFDETQCKCTDPSAPIDVVDRKRFIVQAVEVEPDNTTLYHV